MATIQGPFGNITQSQCRPRFFKNVCFIGLYLVNVVHITKNQSYYKQLLINPYEYGMFIFIFLETIMTCM